jgi:hypothetical protein
MMNVPFERSYWVVPGKLLAGCYPGAKRYDEAGKKLAALLDVAIRCVVNLMEEQEMDWSGDGFEGYQEDIGILAKERGLQIECLRLPIQDVSVPTRAQMKTILDRIDDAVGEAKPAYVHCWGGRGRTGTVVGCYLARHDIATGDETLSIVQQLRKHDPTAHQPSPETERQRQMVRAWKPGE